LFSLQLPLPACLSVFFSSATASTEIYPLSLHDALPIYGGAGSRCVGSSGRIFFHAYSSLCPGFCGGGDDFCGGGGGHSRNPAGRSEEHTSELQSRENIVCRLLLEKKKQ